MLKSYYKNLKLFAVAIIAVSVLFSSCSKDDEDKKFSPKYLVDYEIVKTLLVKDIQGLLQSNDLLPIPSNMVFYGVDALRITYKTVSPTNEVILASGALIVPITTNPLSLVSFQHGTITDEQSAPSYLQTDFTEFASILASAGFVITLPDYLGYGASKHMPHPYEHRASLATACRDMLRATYEYFKVKGLDHGEKLFLTGYSEGGFATMATAKLLNDEHPDEFGVTAITLGAGAYNKTRFAQWVLESPDPLAHINSFVWVLDVYNNLYPKLGREYSYYLQEPYASTIHSQGVWAPILSPSEDLFTAEFRDGVLKGTDTDLLDALADNNCFNWKPRWPIILYHGTDDLYVPYFNSLDAYNSMTALGADVELVTIEGGTHESSIGEYAAGTFGFFLSKLSGTSSQ